FIITGLLLVVPLVFSPGVWFFLFVMLAFQTTLAIDRPAETALLPTIVDSEDLLKANALISIVATLFGLAIGAFLYLALANDGGFYIVYVANAAVLLIALLFSAFLRSPKTTETPTERLQYFSELKAGLVFIKQSVALFLIAFFIFQDIFASIAYVNLPQFAELHTGQASGYIILTALAMVGGLIGSYISRILSPKFEVWKILVACFILAGIVRIIFVNVIPQDFSRALWLYVLYVGLGSTFGMFFHTLMQKLPPKPMIARVNTITTSLFSAVGALGALLGGLLGMLVSNVDTIFIIQGVSYIVIGVAMCLSKPIRTLPKIDEI
ncbi:MAG: MFS transporter, partial [Defluviitaleaceae bacterium]|nr:MFS transporter [Defluviitaleaceae bacterium]